MFKFKTKNPASKLGELQEKQQNLLESETQLTDDLEAAEAKLAQVSLDEALGDKKAAEEALKLESEIATLKRRVSSNNQAQALVSREIQGQQIEIKREERINNNKREIENAKGEIKLLESEIEAWKAVDGLVSRHGFPIGVDHYLDVLVNKQAYFKNVAASTAEEHEVVKTLEAVSDYEVAQEAEKWKYSEHEARRIFNSLSHADYDRIEYHKFHNGKESN